MAKRQTHPPKNRPGGRLIAAAVGLACAAAALGGLCLLAAGGGSEVLGTVNGDPFYREELLLYAERRRAAVSARYSRDYDLPGTGAGFWTGEYGGSQPVDTLLDEALQELVRDKVTQQECVRRGIVAPLDFLALEESLQAENDSRRETLDEGGYVYGTTEYTLDQYSDYQMTMALDELKASLLEGSDAPDRQQLQAAFDSLDESLKRRDFSASGTAFFWQIDADLDRGAAAILAALDAGADPDALPEQLADDAPGLTVRAIELDTAQLSKDDTLGSHLTDVLFGIESGGSLAEVYNGENALYVLDEKTGGGHYTFEEAPGLGENKYVNDACEALIDRLAGEAQVDCDRSRARAAILDALQ